MSNELVSLVNRTDQREERISDAEDKNLDMMQMERERNLRRKNMKELYKN